MISLRYYLSIFLRRLPWFLLVAGVISGVAITVARTLPPAYVSSVRLLVESEQIPGDLAASTVQVSAQEQLQIFQTRLLTRANMLDIARKTQALADLAEMTPDQIVDAMRARTDISTSAGQNRATFMNMSFEAGDARKAAAVLNEYLTLILREDAEYRVNRAGQTQDFFQQEVTRLNDELGAQSARILNFKNANSKALPDSLDYRRGQQLSLQDRQIQVDRAIANMTEQRAKLVEIFETTGRVDAGPSASPVQQRLTQLEAELNQALTVYSENNPKIRILRAQIAQVQSQLEAESGANGTDGTDPARAMFEFQLSEIDTQISQLQEEKTRIETRLDDLTTSIDATPANSIALESLERDYRNIQSQYNQAVSSLAQASTGERIETLSRGRRISVVEQPTTPSQPTKPNRLMIAGGGTAIGILAGLALIVGLEFLNRTARRPVDIVNKLGITPIATIPYLRTRRQKVMRRASLVAMILIVMAVVPATIYALHTYYMPLDLLADRVMNKIGIRG
ncbi:GumC family protein [Pseudooceanicola onchidii]|uniref:GumC family protein n=1 Tax=Pseudooceanicola onchidii TaxID=2562279 RepID=UPI0010AAE901|nr:lipopolysaccharide biosynthesis protein [Pseudooceanicola onchidii]